METERAAVIHTARPRSEGHCLIVPKTHVRSFFELSTETLSEIWELTRQIKERMECDLRPTGWNLRINIGDAGGQTVWHAHMHLVPRFDQLDVSVEDL